MLCPNCCQWKYINFVSKNKVNLFNEREVILIWSLVFSLSLMHFLWSNQLVSWHRSLPTQLFAKKCETVLAPSCINYESQAWAWMWSLSINWILIDDGFKRKRKCPFYPLCTAVTLSSRHQNTINKNYKSIKSWKNKIIYFQDLLIKILKYLNWCVVNVHVSCHCPGCLRHKLVHVSVPCPGGTNFKYLLFTLNLLRPRVMIYYDAKIKYWDLSH